MKILKTSAKTFMSLLLSVLLTAPMVTSCYDDSDIWDKLASLEEKLIELENNLTEQAEAMSALLSDGSTISACKKNSDGSYTITLSNGTKFNVLPEGTSFSSLVTYTEVGGKKCWATYDANGNPVVIKDASGNAIPVSAEISVKIKDDAYYLVINGKEYVTGYNAEDVVQVFSSCTPLMDASGNVYAVKFTFGEGMEVTVALDGYKGVLFKLSSANNSIVSDYYIDYGTTQSFLMEMSGVVDYVMQVPDGWRVKVTEEELTGDSYVYITAPAKETVTLGAAVSEGDLKVVSVVEGGKATVSKMYVSADPFKVYDVTALKAVVEPYGGISKFAYGMMLYNEFDSKQVIEKVNLMLDSNSDYPAGYYVAEAPLDKTFAEIYGSELKVGESYVFWTVNALYGEVGKETKYYAIEKHIKSQVISPMVVSVEVSETTLFDAKTKVRVEGADAVYAGTAEVTESFLDEIIYQVNNGVIDPIEGDLNYDGLVSGFPTKESAKSLNPETEYAVWVVPAKNNKKTYSTADIFYKTFETKLLTDGGKLQITVADPVLTSSSITAALSCDGAAMIYYAFLSNNDGKRYSSASNDTKMSKILAAETCVSVRGTKANAEINELQPGSTHWLFAVAVGQDGSYGQVECKQITTKTIDFNKMELSVSTVEIKDTEAKFKVDVTGGTAKNFIFWVGYENDPFWVSASYCDKSEETASKYMAANPESTFIEKAMRKGVIELDGTVTISDLIQNKNYIFLVLAKDDSGMYSKAAIKRFKTLAVSLGDVVETGSQEWNDTKKWIEDNITWHKNTFVAGAGNGQGSAAYAFNIKIPTDLTAFISCFGTEATEVVDVVVEVEGYCKSATTTSPVVTDKDGGDLYHPDWVDDSGKEHQGHLVNVADFYSHGCATKGYVTYFSNGVHDESNCPTWEHGECSNYAAQMASINKYCSFDYWKEYVIDFCNYNNPSQPEYSYSLTDPAKIDALAQAYLDIYKPLYEGKKPTVYVNDGTALEMANRNATGIDQNTGEVADKLLIVLKDDQGNSFEPMYIDVPNYFK